MCYSASCRAKGVKGGQWPTCQIKSFLQSRHYRHTSHRHAELCRAINAFLRATMNHHKVISTYQYKNNTTSMLPQSTPRASDWCFLSIQSGAEHDVAVQKYLEMPLGHFQFGGGISLIQIRRGQGETIETY